METLTTGPEHHSGTERHLLMIAYKFPPMRSVSCNRTLAFARGMLLYFDAVHVVTTSNRHVLLQDPGDLTGLHVTDAATVDYRTLFQQGKKGAVAGERTKGSVVGKFLARLQSSFPTLHLFGEGNFWYVRNGVRAASHIVERYPVTHIWSTFPPYADHLIARHVKHRNPNLFWIADFRDLHVDPTQDNLFLRNYQRHVNRRILAGADLVTTVSKGLAQHLRAFHQEVQVLRNGIREHHLSYVQPFPRFTVAYTGSMFQDKRKPDVLLAAVRQLLDNGTIENGDIRIRYAGKDSAVWGPLVKRYELSEMFQDYGMLSREEAERIQHRSHVNLLLTYSTDALQGNLTGKLYDYLAARRPILVVINGPKDTEIESLIESLSAGAVVYDNDVRGTARFIKQEYERWKAGEATGDSLSTELLDTLTWPHLLEAFAMENGWTRLETDT